ncbi:MAG: hypothetical protein K2N94_08840 [Lachnospiraceae bacterium]|nr:hypothetical protein [Lachnospiraceae bacterium]
MCDDRYLRIGQYRPAPNGEGDYISRIYDLKTQTFLEDEWLKEARIIDPVLGYFAKGLTEEEKAARREQGNYDDWGGIYDVSGRLLMDNAPIHEDVIGPHRNGNFFEFIDWIYRRKEDGNYTSLEYRLIYDLQLNLKLAAYEDAEMLPPQEERVPGAAYVVSTECLFPEDGEFLVDAAKFLERFGDGEDMECVFGDYGSIWEEFNHPKETKLYSIQYKGKWYHVDLTLSFCWVEGEEKGRPAVQDGVRLPYYFVATEKGGTERVKHYFQPDGEPLLMRDGAAPDEVLSCGDGYALVRIGKNAVTVEEHLPKKDFCGIYTYPAPNYPNDPYTFELHYIGEQCFMTEDYCPGMGRPYSAGQEARIFYGQEEVQYFTAKSIYFGRDYCSNHNVWERYYLQISTGETLTVESEADRYDHKEAVEEIHLHRYLVWKDGKIGFITEPGQMNYLADGYAQFQIGNYDIVYDMDGNIVLRAVNRVLEND